MDQPSQFQALNLILEVVPESARDCHPPGASWQIFVKEVWLQRCFLSLQMGGPQLTFETLSRIHAAWTSAPAASVVSFGGRRPFAWGQLGYKNAKSRIGWTGF